jgi:hypothetical protein
MERVRVTMDCLKGSYEALTPQGVRWNGWVCPSFSRPECERLMRDLVREGVCHTARYDDKLDAFVTQSENEEEPSTWSCGSVDDDPYYAIGAFAWTWELST